MKLLIGCISYNTKYFLEIFLNTLFESYNHNSFIDNETEIKIVVVDNGSTDDTNTLKNNYEVYPWDITWIRNDKNLGISAGWNQLIKAGFDNSGNPLYDYYFICNNDLYITKRWIHNFINCLKQDVNKKFGWISSFMNDYKEPNKTGVIETVNLERLYWSMRPQADTIEGIKHLEELLVAAYGPWENIEHFSEILEDKYNIILKEMHPKAPCFALSKECIKQVGLFDEYNCPVGIHEDADYCRRIKEFSNLKLGAAYGAYVHHYSMMTRTRDELDDDGGWVAKRERAYQDKWKSSIKLDIGSGERPQVGPGWYHMDIDRKFLDVEYLHDCSKSLPFKDNMLDEIYCSNNLEHINWREIPKVLEDWYRCLKPEGKIHIRVPNFKFAIDRYLDNSWGLNYKDKSEFNLLHLLMGGDNEGEPHLHKSLFDYGTLYNLLNNIGFVNIKCVDDKNTHERDRWELRIEATK